MPQDRTGNTQATASHLANPSEIANLTFAPNHAIAFPSVGKEEVLDSYNYLELCFLTGRWFDRMLAAGVVLPDHVHKGRGQLRSLTYLS